MDSILVLDRARPARVAVIGTAGRDVTRPMTKALWLAMVEDLRQRVRASDVLVSGGAAWADHLAVHAFLVGWVAGLELYLPAPLVEAAGGFRFAGGPRTSGAAANHYHELFTTATGVEGRPEIATAAERGALLHAEPVAPGYDAMHTRNTKIARRCTEAVAYTWGEAGHPAQGGTLDTWREIRSTAKVHVSLGPLAAAASRNLTSVW